MYNGRKYWPFGVEQLDVATARRNVDIFGLSCKMEHIFD